MDVAPRAALEVEIEVLRRRLREADEQQTALAEILRVISTSSTDVQPVLDAIVRNAARFCGGEDAILGLKVDGGFSTRAHHGPIGVRSPDERWLIDRDSILGRSVIDEKTVQSADVLHDPEYPATRAGEQERHSGLRAVLATPLMRDGTAIGGIALRRVLPGPFSKRDEELLRAFATQAVIALENVRLFKEIREKSADLETANGQLAQASHNKSEFLANMSHELRTPLNAVIGFSDVLLGGMFGEVNARQREYLEDILTSGRHLLSLVNDILDLSKVEAGKMELQPSVFSLREVVEGSAMMLRERAIKQRIALSVEIEPDLPPIEADERKVKQVLFNLLSNAVKFTSTGGRIDVRARRMDDEIRVSVRDTGLGIAPEDQARIFEEFQQTRTGARTEESTGLGLTLAKRFMELHGGRLWVDSELGKGSTFTFALPLRPTVRSEPA